MNRRRILIGLIGFGLFGIWFLPFFERARGNAISSSCQSNLKQVGLAISQYIRDYDERFPPPRRWRMVLQPYIFYYGEKKQLSKLNLFDCPLKNTGYSYNFFLYGARYGSSASIAEKTPMIFDSTDLSAQEYIIKTGARDEFRGLVWTYGDFVQQKPDYGGSYTKDFRHLRGNNVLFKDGHVAVLTQKPNFAIK